MTQRPLIVLKAVLAGWVTLLTVDFLIGRTLLHWAAPVVGAAWMATAKLAFDCLAFALTGWVTGRLNRARPLVTVALFAATLALHDFQPVLPVDVPWLFRLLSDTVHDPRYADSLIATASGHAFLFGSLAAGAWLARPRRTELLSLAVMHPISMKLAIEGMHCDACVRRVQNAIVSVEGAKAPQVEVGSAVVSVDPKREELVLDAVRKAGYTAHKVE